MDFFTGGSVIMDYGLLWSNSLKLKTSWWICFLQTHSFCLLKMLTDGLEWCGLLVDYCDVFISCLDSHSDGTHSLQSIHCWDSDAMLHFSKSDEETNSSTSWIAWGWAHFHLISIFGWTIPLKCFTYRVKVSLIEIVQFTSAGRLHKYTFFFLDWRTFKRGQVFWWNKYTLIGRNPTLFQSQMVHIMAAHIIIINKKIKIMIAQIN